MHVVCKGKFVRLGLDYETARKIVTAPNYLPIREDGTPQHPQDSSFEAPANNWGAQYAADLFYERQLNDYIAYHFGCPPKTGWTVRKT